MARRRPSFAFAAALALAVASAPEAAHANGRFPRAQRLLERGGDPERLVLSATYGLLLSDDGGAEWRHVCELGFAFAVADIDPLVGVLADGSMLVKGVRSLNRAPAPFCDFEPVLGGASSDTAVDFSVDPADASRVIALVSMRGETGGVVNRIFESTDSARSFLALGAPLPEDVVLSGITLDAAPSDPERLYVSATGRDTSALFLRSGDRGSSWSLTTLPLSIDEFPYIAAIDATNPLAIYVRTDHWVPNEAGAYQANDALYYSDDGGESFREIHRMAGKLFGFALSPDGSEVLVGYGDPVEPSRSVEPAALGIYRASTSDFVFEKIYDGSVSCLAWTASGLYACTSQSERDFALGIAPNADFDLATERPLSPLLDLTAVRAPLDCPACTSGADCLPLWSETCVLFGSCDANAPLAAPSGDECPPGGSGGTGGGGAPAGEAGVENAASGTPPSDSSCGCRIPGAERRGHTFVALAFAALLVRRHRRTRLARARAPKGEPGIPPFSNY